MSKPAASATREMRICAAPKTPRKTKDQRLGKMSDAMMKLPSLRPLEILAKKVPTKGPQLIHQPQKKMVQAFIQPLAPPLLSGAPPMPSEALPSSSQALPSSSQASVQAHHHARRGKHCDDDDDDDLGICVDLDSHPALALDVARIFASERVLPTIGATVKPTQPVVDLHGAQAQGGAYAEDGAEDAEDLDQVAHDAVAHLSDDRVQREAHGQREAAAVRQKREEGTHNDIRDPCMDPPMEEGHHHGMLRASVVVEHLCVHPVRVIVAFVVPHGLGGVVP
mmetsp:Transcript_117995/g.378263  ORF Transcript_117995/g.378263 Transcript_117995/m.378263 type:complete len:280 (-) Transcript_117995:406-1245(-)